MKTTFVAAFTLITLATGPAFAADLPVKAAPLGPIYDWNGAYIGVNGDIQYAGPNSLTGYSGGPGTAAFFAPGGLPTTLASNGNGYSGGAQIGYNWQVSRTWLVGLEADIQGGGYKGNSSKIGRAHV